MNLEMNVSPTYSPREWEKLLDKTFLPGSIDVRGNGPAGLMDSQVRLNRLWLAQLAVRPQSIVHAAPHLRDLSTEDRTSLIAHVVLGGAGFIEQNGKCLTFKAGDISFRNLSEPSRVVFETPGSFYVVRIPALAMQAHRGNRGARDALAPRVVRSKHQLVDVVRCLLLLMSSDTPAFYLSLVLPWLFAAAYHDNESATETDIHAENETRWQQVLNYIEQHLFDGDMLSPRICAEAVGISERYLHRLFAQHGLRFSKTVLARRLDTAHAMLEDSGCRSCTISSIAYRCGFKEAAHFSRLFKLRYGITPRETRSDIKSRE